MMHHSEYGSSQGQARSEKPKLGLRSKRQYVQVVHADILSTGTERGLRQGERILNSSRKAAPMFLKWDSSKVHLMPKDLKDIEPVLEHAGTYFSTNQLCSLYVSLL